MTLRGRKPSGIVIDQSTTILNFGDGSNIRGDGKTAQLYMSGRIVVTAEKVLRPLGLGALKVFGSEEDRL